jgi:integrase
MARPLTVPMIEKLKPDPVKRIEVSDGLLPALRVVVQPSGVKSYALRFRQGGRTKKYTIGPVGSYSLAEARGAARRALADAARGIDPMEAKRASRDATGERSGLVEKVVENFLDKHVRKLRSAHDVSRLLRVELKPWHGRRIEEITKGDVIRLIEAVAERGSPSTARLLLANLKGFYSWLLAQDMLAASPCTGLKPPNKAVQRERVLTDNEFRLVLKGAAGLRYPFGPIVHLLALTGARRDEVAGMRWSELQLDGDEPLWSLPPARTKNGRAHDVPLSPVATEIIRSLPRVKGSDYVFTTTGTSAVSGFSKARKALDELIGSEVLAAWHLHDLRRTFATGCAKLGVALPVVEKCLNHVSGSFAGVVGIYQRYDFAPEKRAAFELWSRHAEGLLA